MAERDFLEGKMPPHLEGLALPIEYLPKEQDAPFKDGKLMGLGEAGLMLALKESLALGTELHLKLHLPKPLLSDSDWQMLAIEAKVVWVDEFLGADTLYRYGTQFLDLPEKERQTLKHYLQLRQWMKDKIRDQ